MIANVYPAKVVYKVLSKIHNLAFLFAISLDFCRLMKKKRANTQIALQLRTELTKTIMNEIRKKFLLTLSNHKESNNVEKSSTEVSETKQI